MRESQYWLLICDTRAEAGYPSMAADPWCRRLLCEAAVDEAPCGADGRIYRFADRSVLVVNSAGATVISGGMS
jgi:hypothetical protein